MTTHPRAFLTRDTGAATIATALLGRVGSRWRLIGSLSLPAGADPDALGALLVQRILAADPNLATALGLDGMPADELPTVEVASHPARRLAVVSGSERSLGPLVAAAARSGWRTSSASTEAVDPLEMSTLLLDLRVSGILAGAGDPPAADERRGLGELGALVAAAARRRPDIPVVLAGGMGGQLQAFGEPETRPAPVLIGSAARSGRDGEGLRELLTDLALPADDARRALGTSVSALADVLDRRVDLVEIGFDGGTRVAAGPGNSAATAGVDLAIVPGAGLAPADPDDAVVERVAAWWAGSTDRHRLRDRMRELRIAPWADAAGEGVALRLAALRAALSCLAGATPEWRDRPGADLVVATGGVWNVVSASSAMLVLADVLRRPGAQQLALDHARVLAPLGSIADPDERRAIIADLADDLLVPLGTIVTATGLRHGRRPGTLRLHGGVRRAAIELRAGGLESIRLAPGASAVAEFQFQESVHLGGRGRHFAIDVTGGLVGLVVDLRGVPLNFPNRADLRNELLETWEAAVRTGTES